MSIFQKQNKYVEKNDAILRKAVFKINSVLFLYSALHLNVFENICPVCVFLTVMPNAISRYISLSKVRERFTPTENSIKILHFWPNLYRIVYWNVREMAGGATGKDYNTDIIHY